MASGYKFKFTRFEKDDAGYQAVLGSAGVTNFVNEKANAIASRADGMMPKNGYSKKGGKHHSVVPMNKTSYSPEGAMVFTHSNMAWYQQERYKTLTKAIGA